MNKLWVLVLVTLSTTSSWIFHSVDSLRSPEIIKQQSLRQGCIWSTENKGGGNVNETNVSPSPKLSPPTSFSLDCNLRTLNVDFWNYTFNKDQILQTNVLRVNCNDKIFFESFLTPNQSLFRLVNLRQIHIDSCKIRKMPGRIWESLGLLKSLVVTSRNGDWSNSVGLEVGAGSFEGLGQLETLDLSQNNIWSLPNKNIFCPLKSLLKLNLSLNRLKDIEELSGSEQDLLMLPPMSTSSTGILNNNANNNAYYCALSVQNLDLSHNSIRRVGANAFSRMRKLSELKLQNNLLEELDDSAFGGLGQMKSLNLSSNKLVAIPPTVFKFNPTLREINLSNNSISALSPQVFGGLDSLLSLDLSKNTLTSQWNNMFHGLLRLVILRLSSNQLSFVDGTIFKDLTHLQALYLDGNRIETINPAAFSSLSNLHVLDLTRNRLSFIDSRVFSNLIVLRQLYLDHNKIRSMDESALKNCTSLQDLGMADNLLQEVPVALKAGLVHLVTLDIGENRIGVVNNESFSGLGQLYGLRIVDNRLTEIPHDFCNPLKKLRVLNTAQNRISKISPTAFTSCPELRALRLDTNLLEELPTALAPQLPSLLWLNVSENRLRWADYHLLPPTIEWLDLSYNSLETLGGPSNAAERSQSSTPYSLRVLDASHNHLTTLDYTTIPPTLETLRVNYNRLKTVASDTFSRSTRLRRVEIIGNLIENLPLSSLRFPQVPIGKTLPEFYLGGNPFQCNCEMEWLTRVNQLTVLRTHPRIVDLDAIVCRPTFSRPSQIVPLVETRPKDFLCPYKSHCFALCHCCDFDACDCEMQCPQGCNCYHDTSWSSNIVECSNSNFQNVPSRIPMDASEVYLDGNNMTALGSHIFIGKKNVRVLFLNDSKVEFVRNKTFNGLKALEVLRLEDNLLTELNGFEFSDLENLRELYLQNNLLRFIAKETFSQLKFLQVLRLDGNNLIDFNVWELSGNGYLNSVMVSGNPWSCSCDFLIPFRTWVASKTSIVVDFTLANCQTVNSTHLSPGTTFTDMDEQDHHHQQHRHYPSTNTDTTITTNLGSHVPHSANNDNNRGQGKMYPIQMQYPIASMCSHSPELNFNFNPVHPGGIGNSEILHNHISSIAGGAEKVTIPHPPSSTSDQEIQFGPGHVDSSTTTITHLDSMNTFWTLLLSLTALIVLVVVIAAIFRKEIYCWIYTRLCGNNTSELGGGGGGRRRGRGLMMGRGDNLLPSLLFCCGEKVRSKTRSSGESGGGGGGVGCDEADKLFDAYFIHSSKDEDILAQKIAPELESQGPPYFRLCLHYRDLACLNPDNPWNGDMILSACDASKRVVLILSRTFLQSELSHSHFRQAIQSAINRHQKKLILILLPPFTEQNLSTIYPELKNSSQVKSSTLEWTDKNFWSKLKLVLPTPSNIGTFSSATVGRRGSSNLNRSNRRGSSLLISGTLPSAPAPLIDLNVGLSTTGGGGGGGSGSSNNSNASGTMSSYTINRLEFPYSSQHHHQYHYHRNILPYQVPLSNASTLNPPVPKHHIALTTPFITSRGGEHPQAAHYQSQQNFGLYSGSGSQYGSSIHSHSQHYFLGNNNVQNFISIPGIPAQGTAGVYPVVATLPHPPPNPVYFSSFNESFKRHLQQQQKQNSGSSSNNNNTSSAANNNANKPTSPLVLQFAKQSSGGNGVGTGYQPLEANYSSSAISSSAEELEHVYSTLDSPPYRSPHNSSADTASTLVTNSSPHVELQQKVGDSGGGESANKLGNSSFTSKSISSNRNSCTGNGQKFSSQPHHASTFNPNTVPNEENLSGESSGESHPHHHHRYQQQPPPPGTATATNGQMYFV